jgi:dynein heavy chain 1, cytosolic
MSRISEGL